MKNDRYFYKHYTYYIREMRIIAYNQLLESYSSLTLKYMSDAFGVTTNFIDKSENVNSLSRYTNLIIFLINREISRFIAASRLHAKIDKVNGIVETNRPDNKNWQYQVNLYKILLNILFSIAILFKRIFDLNKLIFLRRQLKKEIYFLTAFRSLVELSIFNIIKI